MADNVKKRIVEGASSLFLKEGIKRITMNEIAEKMGMSKRTLYENFKDKNELVFECLQSLDEYYKKEGEKIKGNSANALVGMIKLQKLGEETIGNVNPKFFDDLKYLPGIEEHFNKQKNKHIEDVAEGCKRGIEEGVIRDDINPKLISVILSNGLGKLVSIVKEYAPDVSIKEIYSSVFSVILNGITTEKGKEIIEIENKNKIQ